MPAPASTNQGGAERSDRAGASSCGSTSTWARRRPTKRATNATRRLSAQAVCNVSLVPSASSKKKVASTQPVTAPSVLTP